MIRPLLLLAMLATAGCATAPPPPAVPDDAQASRCPIVASSDWTAWVNAMPGPTARPTLIMTGKVTVPTGGYSFGWGTPLVAESFPVQIIVELRPIPAQGLATQEIVTHDVRGQWPSDHQVGSIRIVCGGRQLASIAPVETAH